MDTWSVYTDFAEALSALFANPAVPPDEELAIIEQYFVYLYDRSSETSTVNVARLELFCRKERPSESIPLTHGALNQYILRSIYQANCWEQMSEKSQNCWTLLHFDKSVWKDNGRLSGHCILTCLKVRACWSNVEAKKLQGQL